MVEKLRISQPRYELLKEEKIGEGLLDLPALWDNFEQASPQKAKEGLGTVISPSWLLLVVCGAEYFL